MSLLLWIIMTWFWLQLLRLSDWLSMNACWENAHDKDNLLFFHSRNFMTWYVSHEFLVQSYPLLRVKSLGGTRTMLIMACNNDAKNKVTDFLTSVPSASLPGASDHDTLVIRWGAMFATRKLCSSSTQPTSKFSAVYSIHQSQIVDKLRRIIILLASFQTPGHRTCT